MKLPALLEPASIGGGGFVVSKSPFPTVPEIAVTLVNPAGAVAPPSPATVPSLRSATPPLCPPPLPRSRPRPPLSLRGTPSNCCKPPPPRSLLLCGPGKPKKFARPRVLFLRHRGEPLHGYPRGRRPPRNCCCRAA